jgi:hypothetical protein
MHGFLPEFLRQGAPILKTAGELLRAQISDLQGDLVLQPIERALLAIRAQPQFGSCEFILCILILTAPGQPDRNSMQKAEYKPRALSISVSAAR